MLIFKSILISIKEKRWLRILLAIIALILLFIIIF